MPRIPEKSRRKSLDRLLAEMAGEHQLRRALGPVALTAVGIGAVIGAGIFVQAGDVARDTTGPAIVVSFLIAGVACALAALCYAEFAALAPLAGSTYTYAYVTLGEVFAWLIGWLMVLEYGLSCSAVAASWTGYLSKLLEVFGAARVPPQLAADPWTAGGPALNLPAVVLTGALTLVILLGVRESARVNGLLVLLKLGVVLFVIVAGAQFINTENWHRVPPPTNAAASADAWGVWGDLGVDRLLAGVDQWSRGSFAPFGLSGVMLGASIVFFSFIGFEAVSTHVEEAVRPARDVPLGLLASLTICGALYIAVAVVITGMTPYTEIAREGPLAAAFGQVQQGGGLARWSQGLVALGALVAMTSVVLVTFQSQVRIFMAMARDGLLPPIFGRIHPRLRTPHAATALTGLAIAVPAACLPLDSMWSLVSLGTLAAFTAVCVAVLVLRVREPDIQRPFRCPAVWVVAPAGVLVNVTLMLFQPRVTWLWMLAWLGAGLALYLVYGRRHSVVGRRLLAEIRTHGLSPSDAPLE